MKNKKSHISSQYETCINEIDESIRRFAWGDFHSYACWLLQTHQLVRHTTTLLTMMATKFGPENMESHHYTLKHLREETGHDQMALKDIEMLGAKASDYPELMETSVLYQSQYYWMERFGGNALSGYALMLEGLSIKKGPWILEQVQKAHGEKAALFLKVHVREDVEHYRSGLERLATIPENELEVVLKNLRQSTQMYPRMLEGISKFVLSLSGKPKIKLAA